MSFVYPNSVKQYKEYIMEKNHQKAAELFTKAMEIQQEWVEKVAEESKAFQDLKKERFEDKKQLGRVEKKLDKLQKELTAFQETFSKLSSIFAPPPQSSNQTIQLDPNQATENA